MKRLEELIAFIEVNGNHESDTVFCAACKDIEILIQALVVSQKCAYRRFHEDD